jgi:hypothetical protein
VHAYISYVLEDVGLVFVSADREAFEDLQQWKAIVLEVSYTLQASCLSVRNWRRIKRCRRFRNLYLFILILLVSVPSAGLRFVLIQQPHWDARACATSSTSLARMYR